MREQEIPWVEKTADAKTWCSNELSSLCEQENIPWAGSWALHARETRDGIEYTSCLQDPKAGFSKMVSSPLESDIQTHHLFPHSSQAFISVALFWLVSHTKVSRHPGLQANPAYILLCTVPCWEEAGEGCLFTMWKRSKPRLKFLESFNWIPQINLWNSINQAGLTKQGFSTLAPLSF